MYGVPGDGPINFKEDIRKYFTENKHLRWIYFGRALCAKEIGKANFPRWKMLIMFEEELRGHCGCSERVRRRI